VAQQISLRLRGENGSPFRLGEKIVFLCVICKKEREGNSARGGVPPWGLRANRAESDRAGVLQEPAFK
jgi:hypothetical protein